jgi:hypothetical protein
MYIVMIGRLAMMRDKEAMLTDKRTIYRFVKMPKTCA